MNRLAEAQRRLLEIRHIKNPKQPTPPPLPPADQPAMPPKQQAVQSAPPVENHQSLWDTKFTRPLETTAAPQAAPGFPQGEALPRAQAAVAPLPQPAAPQQLPVKALLENQQLQKKQKAITAERAVLAAITFGCSCRARSTSTREDHCSSAARTSR